ncbi:MAG TPA: hypothetical protein VH477_13415 [Bryobacteraceae bacterium]
MPAFKPAVAKILDTGLKLLAPAGEVPVIEDDDVGSSQEFDGRDVVSKIARQVIQPVTSSDAEAISTVICILEKACSGMGKRTPIPGGIPSVIAVVNPFVVNRPMLRLNCAVEQKRRYQRNQA